ncbi:TIR domain-containing protein [Aliamphritea hakodatensis]|uniref:TIR domain-containing protein n=1 Tax=Aliamphritea hakodatensis TaxID=2895352 RepID=UPI0022FD9180|nr:TIR domain-containing protein [Aliamphritea hakodatensis]
MSQRHKVFVSYHHANDQSYRDRFERLFAHQHDILLSQSVRIGDINENLPAERIRQIIRDEYLRESTVTVVLIGTDTWKRKHVDWEIGASIRDTRYNSRSGLIGILLPSYHLPARGLLETLRDKQTENNFRKYNPKTLPPRLVDNVNRGFAKIYDWSDDPCQVQRWIHQAFNRRNRIVPDNSLTGFVNNRSGTEWQR